MTTIVKIKTLPHQLHHLLVHRNLSKNVSKIFAITFSISLKVIVNCMKKIKSKQQFSADSSSCVFFSTPLFLQRIITGRVNSKKKSHRLRTSSSQSSSALKSLSKFSLSVHGSSCKVDLTISISLSFSFPSLSSDFMATLNSPSSARSDSSAF